MKTLYTTTFFFITFLFSMAQSTIQGRLVYANTQETAVDGVRLVLKDVQNIALDSVTTTQDGSFSFANVQGGDYHFTIYCNKTWGGGNAVDALAVAKHFVGMTLLAGISERAADVDASGYVNTVDALAIIKRFVGQQTYFPAGDWLYEGDSLSVPGNGILTHVVKARCYGDTDGSHEPAACTPWPSVAYAGQNQLYVSGNTTTLSANPPTTGNGCWRILSGTGGSFADSTLHNTSFTGIPGVPYYLCWTVSTTCYSNSDTLSISVGYVSGQPCQGIPSFVYGGQTYNTVQIGSQCWMKENLNIGTMITSSPTGVSHSDCSNNGIIEKYCGSNNILSCNIYGGLYDWNEMMEYTTTSGCQGICPAGWHIPTDAEWCILTAFLDTAAYCNTFGWSGANAGGKLKEAGYSHWDSPNAGATNISGFKALGAGGRGHLGAFYYSGFNAFFWTSTPESSANSIARNLTNTNAGINRVIHTKPNGFQVRCIKNP